jgi:hypothetical protein
MAGGHLGDARLNGRRDRVMAVLEEHPDATFPEACADDAEVEALYRFLRNPRVQLPTLIAPHVTATQARSAAVGEVLVVHDTTDFVFAGAQPRAGLARLGAERHGFWLHAALAVSADGLRAPLGVLSLLPFVRPPVAEAAARGADRLKESHYWSAGVAAVRDRLGATGVIHVMDRGADSYDLFAQLHAQQDRFVVRLHHDRGVWTEAGPSTLQEAGRGAAVRGERTVTLPGRRRGDRPLQARRKHPARAERRATLQVTACRLTVQRPTGRLHQLPPTLTFNAVYVWETSAPAGEEPVAWSLLTTEPIDTPEQVWRIVDWYRARWVIEEFFKALKTGCAYETRQLESLQTLLVALALLVPVAWQLLLLRQLARAAPEAAATAVLSRRQLQVLQTSSAGLRLGPTPTLRDALRAVARLGGHLRQNGDPGWLVLGRGMQKLLWMEAGWIAATQQAAGCDQS